MIRLFVSLFLSLMMFTANAATPEDEYKAIAEAINPTTTGMGGINMTDAIGVAIEKAIPGANPKDFLWHKQVEWKRKVNGRTIHFRMTTNFPVAVPDKNTGQPCWNDEDELHFDISATIENVYDELQKKIVHAMANKVATIGTRVIVNNVHNELLQYYDVGPYRVYAGIGPGEARIIYYNACYNWKK